MQECVNICIICEYVNTYAYGHATNILSQQETTQLNIVKTSVQDLMLYIIIIHTGCKKSGRVRLSIDPTQLTNATRTYSSQGRKLNW